jgi:SAM-dependent methyltransferase
MERCSADETIRPVETRRELLATRYDESVLHTYYQRPGLWEPARYTTGYERDRMVAAVNLIPTDAKSLLDVGCGNGAFLSLAEEMRPDILATGVEPSQPAIDKKWCSSSIVVGEITSLPFPDRSFDVVCSMAVLEHVPSHRMAQGLYELQRVCRSYILIDLPFRERRTRIRCPQCGCAFDPHLHLRSYSEREIHSLFPLYVVKKQLVLRGRELLIPYVVLRVLRCELSAERFPHAVCPQCEHCSVPPAAKKESEGRERLLGRLWRLQPAIAVEREVFVLFARL